MEIENPDETLEDVMLLKAIREDFKDEIKKEIIPSKESINLNRAFAHLFKFKNGFGIILIKVFFSFNGIENPYEIMIFTKGKKKLKKRKTFISNEEVVGRLTAKEVLRWFKSVSSYGK